MFCDESGGPKIGLAIYTVAIINFISICLQYNSGILIIRHDNEVLRPSGEFSASVSEQPTDGEDKDEDEGLVWWHILLIAGATIAVFVGGVVVRGHLCA